MKKEKPKVLLIGWDAADWKIINKLIDQGEMPTLKSFVEQGVMGNISTLEPPYSPMLWTTIATGKYPDKHGILGFSEPVPDHSAIRPVSNSSRKVKALWNILTQNDYKTHVINWWPSHPAEPVNGIYVSNMFPKVKSVDITNKCLPDDTVHPSDLQDLFAHFTVHPLELSFQHIQPFFPEADLSKIKIDKKFQGIAKIIAEASSVQAAATLALDLEEWDFAAVYWDSIDHFCHGFMNYSPPKMKGIKEDDYQKFKYVVYGGYRLMDMMLARLLELAGDNCNVIITSDHGFQSAELRQKHTPNEPAGPAFHHRNIGVFCAKGPGIKKDEIVYGASLLDITPTILTLFGLPVGNDMDGKPLVDIFTEKPEVLTIPSWEHVQGECGMLPDEKRDLNPENSAVAIQQLIDLGYIEDPGDDIKEAVERTVDELDYNLALVYYGTQRFHLAKPLFEKLFEKNPYRGRYVFKLIDCYLDEGEYDKAEKILVKFKTEAEKKILSKEQTETIKNRNVPEILKDKEKDRWVKENLISPLKESSQACNDLYQATIYEGDLLLKKGFPKKALKKYKEISSKKVKSRSFYAQMGKAFIKTQQWEDAEKMYLELLKLDPDHSIAYLGIGISNFNLKNYNKALEYLLESVTLNFYNNVAHFNIGRTLIELGDLTNGVNALETALRINPNFGLARNMLIDIYDNRLNEYAKSAILKQNTDPNIQDKTAFLKNEELIIKPVAEVLENEPVIVVSGLPRSGTSLMMQMLKEGGVPLFTDDIRKPDANNPKGYFEHEKVKQLIRNSNWMKEAIGKAVKIVLPILYKLPARYNYKVIFMLRDIQEVVESQHKMLVRDGKIKNDQYAMGIESSYLNYLNHLKTWGDKNSNVEILFIEYRKALENPDDTVHLISKFLKKELKLDEMKKAVLPDLYRTKIG